MGVLTLVVLWYFVVTMFATQEEWIDENDKFEWLGPNPFTDPRNHPCNGMMMTERDSVMTSYYTWFNPQGLLMGIPYFCT